MKQARYPLAEAVTRECRRQSQVHKSMGVAKLIFFCGRMAAGKSTLARDLAKRENAVLLVQDDFLSALFPGEITDIPGYVKCSSRLKNALTSHVCALLSQGISVVLDFPANTKAQRAWFRELIERTHVEHELHFVDASDAVCKTQLRERSRGLPAGTRWTTEEDFEAINAYFQPPSEDENFNIVRHERAQASVQTGGQNSGSNEVRLTCEGIRTDCCEGSRRSSETEL